jgi:hypothetical protein
LPGPHTDALRTKRTDNRGGGAGKPGSPIQGTALILARFIAGRKEKAMRKFLREPIHVLLVLNLALQLVDLAVTLAK